MVDDLGFPPPGQFVDVGSHKMHLYSMGEGSPVVVLDSGSGDSLLTWTPIQAEIAKFTRVVAYDRSGMGWSERGPNAVTPKNVADDLDALLKAADITAPLIVVGHSLGGVYMRAFVHRHPEQVAGLILIDSSHESQGTRFGEAVPSYIEFTQAHIALLKELSGKSHQEIVDHFFPPAADAPPISEAEAMVRDRMRPTQLATVSEELDYAYKGGLTQTADAIPSLGDLRLTILTATRPPRAPGLSESDSQSMSTIFQGLQTEISQRSTRGKQIFVPEAGHYIHRDQPQVVIEAIREMVESVRADVTII